MINTSIQNPREIIYRSQLTAIDVELNIALKSRDKRGEVKRLINHKNHLNNDELMPTNEGNIAKELHDK